MKISSSISSFNMKKFLIKVVLVLLPVLLLIVGVNYFGDAANLFSNNYEYKIAKGMLAGKNVTNTFNYDERLLQRLLINQDQSCPDVVVLGSSRVMLVHSGYFPGQKLFNNSVSAATVEDIMAIFSMYDEKQCYPKELVIGIDPHTFTENVGKSRWKTLEKEYNTIIQKLSGKASDVDGDEKEESKYWQLVSLSYFTSSIKKLMHNPGEPVITDNPVNDAAITHHPDGSITYDKKYREPTPARVEAKAAEYQNSLRYGIKTNTELSPDIKDIFEKLIVYLKSKNCKVTLVVPPLHPKVFDYISKNPYYQQLKSTEQFCRTMSSKHNNVQVLGAFDPGLLGMDETYFYDGNHCNVKGIDALFSLRK